MFHANKNGLKEYINLDKSTTHNPETHGVGLCLSFV